jgi:hypothetical protein
LTAIFAMWSWQPAAPGNSRMAPSRLIDSRSNKACRVAQEEIAAGKVKAAPPRTEVLEEVVPHEPPKRYRIQKPSAVLASFRRTIIAMKVTVGVSGGIAAYKAAELVRALQRQALDVHVVMTEAAQKFITPLTFASLTGHKVITGLWPSPNETGGERAISTPPLSTLAKRSRPKPWWLPRQPPTCWQNSLMGWPTTS